MELKISGDARVNHAYNNTYQSYNELDLLAESAANLGDDAATARYNALRDRMIKLGPLLEAPYLDPVTEQPDVAKYESDLYLVKTTALSERFTAASQVKDAWDNKANTYIVHLTLLAVALFLYGLSTTVSSATIRWIFAGTGSVVSLVTCVWIALTFAKAVPDLRDCKLPDGGSAIDAYADGVGLAYQSKSEQAIPFFNKALSCEPSYANALRARGNAHSNLGDFKAAATDYEATHAAGNTSSSLAGELAWTYYLLGRFDDASSMNRTALESNASELWIQFDLGTREQINTPVFQVLTLSSTY